MYLKLRLFELKNTKFKKKPAFFTELNKGFRGGEIYISGEFFIPYSTSQAVTG